MNYNQKQSLVKMDKQTLLKVENLGVELDGHSILKNLSFDLKNQEVLAIIGPNGSGKTVLLKTLLGLIKPSNGKVTWVDNIKIGYLPQRFHVDHYLPMSVDEFLRLKSAPKYSVQEVLKLVGLNVDAEKHSLAHLSGGQLQKVLLAWTILDSPDVLLFDEPTENVDPVSEESIYHLLHKLQDTLGIAMIIISHDLNIVYRYANNVLCLNQKMICYGEPQKTLTTDRLGELYGDHAFFHHHHPENK